MKLELAKSVITPALAESLCELLARVDLAYLLVNPGLPCCPMCAGTKRQECGALRDVATLLKMGCGNSMSLAAWQLAEAWKDGVTDARAIVREPGDGPTPTAGGPDMSCPDGKIPTHFESPPGSGNYIWDCQPWFTSEDMPQLPQGAGGITKTCPPGKIWKVFESPPSSGQFIGDCVATIANTSEKGGDSAPQPGELYNRPSMPPGAFDIDARGFRFYVLKGDNLIDIAERYSQGFGCNCG